ncbi:MAG: 6-phosphofructokinase [Bacteriovoracaceae bacterium]|nr:6-phosphofructokinase [Bacteriovoracaceae bacterium]
MKQKTIGILTGGADVPALNAALRAVTIRATKEGYHVLGIVNGWNGLINIDQSRKINEQVFCRTMNIDSTHSLQRKGGTVLGTSRIIPNMVKIEDVPDHLKDKYNNPENDLTEEVLKNIEYLEIDTLIVIGGLNTLTYAASLHKLGVKIIAIPKTMDNNINGSDYSLGFSTCVTRTVQYTHQLRTCASSHHNFLIVEVFGRYAGFSSIIPCITGAADRCLIPEHPFDVEEITELLVEDRKNGLNNYSILITSEGATPTTGYQNSNDPDKNWRGIGRWLRGQLEEISPKFNNGRKISAIDQHLGYMVRSGDPDAVDSIVAVAFGNLAINLLTSGKTGTMVSLMKSRYEYRPIGIITSGKKTVDVSKFYDSKRYRPRFTNIEDKPMWIL